MQADLSNLSVEGTLGCQTGWFAGIQGNIEFRDVDLYTEIAEANQIAGERIQRVWTIEREIDVHLEPDAVERRSSRPEILRHGVNRVGLSVDRFGIVVVVEELGQSLLATALCGRTSPWREVS